MFTIDNFIQLMKYFKGDSTAKVDPKTIITAEDSKAKATILFNENIDLTCYTTEDYKRLKNFLISWYASLRTIPSTMKNASDVRSLPNNDLNELFKSFGVVDSIDNLTELNKIEFFYDLVNLYKIKGTPESLIRVLGYFGIPNVELIEYYLKYDSNYDLIFRPLNLSPSTNNIPLFDIPFSVLTADDPHWFTTEDQINQLFLRNRIAFPSKSPYFSFRPNSKILGSNITPIYAILTRLVLDQYDSFMSGSPPVKDITLQESNIELSLLDLYLGCLYAFNLLYNKTTDSSDISTFVYNGDMSVSYSDIIETYDDLLKRTANNSRDLLKSNKIIFDQTFTRLRSTNFLDSLLKSGTVLNSTNPDLKELIDHYYTVSNTIPILKLLLTELTSWIQKNISYAVENLSMFIFGFDFLDYIVNIINFFKPYRARLISMDQAYEINAPLFDAVLFDDEASIDSEDTFIDFDVADSLPGFATDYVPEGIDITSTPPNDLSRRISEIFVDSTGVMQCHFIDSTSWTNISTDIYSSPTVGQYRVTNIYLDLPPNGGQKLYFDYLNPEIMYGTKTKIESSPPPGFFTVIDLYLNSSLQLEIVYNNEQVLPVDSTARIYFSRITYDCGSYFDIGASCDDPPEPMKMEITQTHDEIDNYHKGVATNDYNYSTDSAGNVNYVLIDSGWSDFDTGMIFDSSMKSDVVKIHVYDVLSQISQTEDDGSVEISFFDNEICEVGI